MTQHHLQERCDTEVLWFQRRSFLQAAAAWTAAGSLAGAQAQSRSNIVELVGDATWFHKSNLDIRRFSRPS